MKTFIILLFQFLILFIPQMTAQVSPTPTAKQQNKSLEETDVVLAGAALLGSSVTPTAGTIRWSGDDFEGYTGFNWVSLTTNHYGSIKDVDGNSYRFRSIGDQVWMIDNLRVTRYNNGDPVNFSTNINEWFDAVDDDEPTYTQIEDETNYTSVFGLLYNGHVLDPRTNGDRNICPAGWHAPSQAEFEMLKSAAGGFTKSSTLKARGTLVTKTGPWKYFEDIGMTNVTGFDAMPAGYRSADGAHVGRSDAVHLWSSTIIDSEDSFSLILSNSNNLISTMANRSRDSGVPIRCVKD